MSNLLLGKIKQNALIVKIRQNPLHIVYGLGFIYIGLWLMRHDHYFIWPPQYADYLNDDTVGYSFFLIGSSILVWTFIRDHARNWDEFNLITAGTVMFLLAICQLMSGLVGEYPMHSTLDWIASMMITFGIADLARRSDNGD
ncbi:hypothetical protein HWN39_10765 [Lactobacillus rhamnosus]|uniref:Uncharacterized protein n=1 Tax=Lacticaseibacillus rhamnosus TaxID=47715 RepID=A0A7Y7UJY5_LACRH|nr:hypothetical protein [Lacticaseibacillus rhamnosus]NVO88960.1 hypothetical protein [Lacticaseibacillus rhamnosus]